MGNIVFSNVSFLFDMKTKVCTKCKEDKGLDQFCKNNANKDGINNSCKSCRKLLNKNNIHIIKEYNKRYKIKTPDYNKIYYLNHKEKIQKQIKAAWVYRYNNDPLFKLSNDIRVSINKNIKSSNFIKSKRTEEILGCSFEEFKYHLESKFEPWMNWDNKGYPKDGVFEFNKKTSPIDLTDVIETRDTVQNFKNAVNSYKGVEIFKTPAGDLIILKDCQVAKGKKRGDVFLMSFGEFTAAFSYAEGL